MEPYHPVSTGQARTYQEAIWYSVSIAELERFLFQYRLMPHSTTGVSPTELLYRESPSFPSPFSSPRFTAGNSTKTRNSMC